MPKPWSEVEKSTAYRSLSPVAQQEAKHEYFRDVVMSKPEYNALSDAEKKEASQDFFKGVKPTAPKKPLEWKDVPGEIVKNAPESASNFGSSAKNSLGGMIELVAHPIKSAETLGLGVLGAIEHIPGAEGLVKKLNPEVARKAMDTANAIGGMYKKNYGTPEAVVNTFKKDPVAAAADISTLISGGAGLLKGVAKVAGTASSVGSAASAASKAVAKAADVVNPVTAGKTIGQGIQKGANALSRAGAPQGVTNALHKAGGVVKWAGPQKPMELVGGLAKDAVGATMNALNPKAKALLTALEGEGRQVIDKVNQGGHEIVPGSKPTLAEVVADLKLTKLAQFDQAAKKHLTTQAARQQMATEAAEVNLVGEIAKTKSELKAAKTARDEISKPLYDKAKAKTAIADEKLAEILDRPSTEDVLRRAARIAREDGKSFIFEESLPKRTVDSVILDSTGQPLKQTLPAQFAKYRGDVLHYMKLGYDDLINDPKVFPPAVKSTERGKIVKTRDEFVKWMEKDDKIPEYKTARETHAEMSEPIDRMRVGQTIKKKLAGAHGEDASANRLTTYENALEDAPRTVKSSTGRVVEELSDMLPPEDVDKLNRVRENIRRRVKNERLAKYGQGTDPRLDKMATDVVGTNIIPPLFNTMVSVVRGVGGHLKNKIDLRMASRVATELLAEDLNIPVAAIEKALEHEMKVKKTLDKMDKVGRGVNALNRAPAVYNMLSPETQNNNALSQ